MINRGLAALTVALFLCKGFGHALAAETSGSVSAAKRPAPSGEASPVWGHLSERQRDALAPLKKLWPEINEAQKRKWLAVSRNYHELPELEQQKMHERMRDWVRLGTRERAQARLEYARAQTLSVDERRQRWEAYMALSDDERKQLADQPIRQPKGAAIAPRPVPATKITPVPASTRPNAPSNGFSALRLDTDQIHPRTLLPLNVPGHASP
ncbi:MAG: DUF3106 domain-containing protein [Alphaproteobacteria bacterium]|nr:DUF3106 domain-containing protein [Alphaproteobacteria bacterium]